MYLTKEMIDGYHGPYTDIVHIGDEVEDKFVDSLADELPPAYMNAAMFQVGEPYDCMEDVKTGIFRDRYETFKKWKPHSYIYCGYCFLGKTEEPKHE